MPRFICEKCRRDDAVAVPFHSGPYEYLCPDCIRSRKRLEAAIARISRFDYTDYVGMHSSKLFKHMPTTWKISSVQGDQVVFYHPSGVRMTLILDPAGIIRSVTIN